MDIINNATSFAVNSSSQYMSVLEELQKSHVHLSYVEQLWAAWYQWMDNDVLATGIIAFWMHEIVYFGRCIPWIIIGCIPWFDKYKLQATKVPTWREQFNCALLVFASHFTVEIAQIWFFHPFATYLGMVYEVPFPPWYKMAYQIAVFFVLEDAWHYGSHRALHYGPLYKSIHKLHHFYSAPFGLAAEYASPIEVMILGLGTVGGPALWVWLTGDLHLFTMYVWIFLRLFQAVDAHSGYDFPWSLHHFLPFWAGAEHHDVHHEKFIGNYASSFRWCDKIFDTEAGPEASKRRREKKLAAIRKGQ